MSDQNDNTDIIVMLQVKLDNHIKEYQRHREEQLKQWKTIIHSQEENTRAISSLNESTKDLINVWRAAEGTMSSLSAIGRFMKWLSGFAIISVIIGYFTKLFE